MEVESSVTTHEHFVRLAHEILRGWSKKNQAQQKNKKLWLLKTMAADTTDASSRSTCGVPRLVGCLVLMSPIPYLEMAEASSFVGLGWSVE